MTCHKSYGSGWETMHHPLTVGLVICFKLQALACHTASHCSKHCSLLNPSLDNFTVVALVSQNL